MGIVDFCSTLVAEYEEKVRAEAVDRWKREVEETIDFLFAAGRFPLAASDREWLLDFIIERPDHRWKTPERVPVLFESLVQQIVTQDEICQWMEASLARLLLVIPAPAPLPEREPGDYWEAVEVVGKLYCCGCRSLYEGMPLSEGDLNWLREGQAPYCGDCGIDL